MKIYYTYAYLREDGTPYYIGKGHGNRCYESRGRQFPVPKNKSRILFLKTKLTEEEAFKHECYMISVYGRKDLGTGILRNLTDGGEGSSGAVRSEKTKEICSANKLGDNNPNKGKSWYYNTETKEEKCFLDPPEGWVLGRSPLFREKMSEEKKSRVVKQSTCEKLRKLQKGKKAFVNQEGVVVFRMESPGTGWKPGRKWK